jgi:endonuclease YncB( thermonuclease family)
MRDGWTKEVEIVKWRDADTPIVEVKWQIPIRLADFDRDLCFNSPEKNTPRGKEALEFVQKILKGRRTKLRIDTDKPLVLMDINSFDRLVGALYYEGEPGFWTKVTDLLYAAGFGEFKKY